MENNKTLLIAFVLIAIAACSLVNPLSEDGWVYVKEDNLSKAHAKFLEDFSRFPDSLDIMGGLSYTFLVFNEMDSSKHYLDLTRAKEKDNNFFIFASLLYFRDEPDSASFQYRKFVSKYSSFPLYAVRDAIKSNTLHKLGLTTEILRDSFDYAYGVLKRITEIDDSLNMNLDEDRFLVIEYINSLEE
ncbi:MAG: hypothetical protein PHW02_00295 [bacterium]|nr:hypothetical protein [bacterium]